MSSVTKGKGFTTRGKPVMGTRKKTSRPVTVAEAMPFGSEGAAAMPFGSDSAEAMPFGSDGAAAMPVGSDGAAAMPFGSDGAAAAPVVSEGAAAAPVVSEGAAAAPASPMNESPGVAPLSPVADVVPNYDFPVVYYLITHADIQRSPTCKQMHAPNIQPPVVS